MTTLKLRSANTRRFFYLPPQNKRAGVPNRPQRLPRQLRGVHGAAEAPRPHHGPRPALRRAPHPRVLHVLEEGGHKEGRLGDLRVLRVLAVPVRESVDVSWSLCVCERERRVLGTGF